ncbi:carbohydrate-binding protein [Thraustotheca clavata]|uniref:Carbohydrate-binding protein n=1 Tax=Thraustotheca clavata TaxID=74557 RepID=A0A1V9ZZ85_9STRA|nr:carbohydrate-binding protein [Thraustotheca clavata]
MYKLQALITASYICYVHAFTGDVTAYSYDWQGGNCKFTSLWGNFDSAGKTHFAAINKPQWDDKMNCGLCASVRCTSAECSGGQPIIVQITDQCPECLFGSLDLSIQGFRELTGNDPARYKIEWDFIECPNTFVNGAVEYYVDSGSNNNYIAIQPRNFLKQIVSLEIKSAAESSWRTLTPPNLSSNTVYLFIGDFSKSFPSGPFQLRATAADHSTLIESFPGITVGQTLYGVNQFESSSSTTTTTSVSATASPTTSISNTVPPPATASTTSTPTPTTATVATTSTPLTPATVATTTPPATTLSPATTTAATSTSTSTSSCTISSSDYAAYELKTWSGGFSVQIYIYNPSLDFDSGSWSISLSLENVATITESWHSITAATNDPNVWEMTSTSYNTQLVNGANYVGILGTTSFNLNASVQSITLFYANQTKSCDIATYTHNSVLSQSLANTSTAVLNDPGTVVGIVMAVLMTVVAIAGIVYIRRRDIKAAKEAEKSALTPCHLVLSTPMTPQLL